MVWLLVGKKMFCCRESCRLLLKSVNVSQNYVIYDHRRHYVHSKIKLLTKILKLPSHAATRQLVEQSESLKKVDQKDIINSLEYLNSIKISLTDIRKQPTILGIKKATLCDRHEILMECGCSAANSYFLNRYSQLSCEPEISLKKLGIIDNDINLQQQLADHLNVELSPCEESESLTVVRMHILRLFYLKNNFMTAKEFDAAIAQHPQVKHRSYRKVQEIQKILIDQYHIPSDKIKDYFTALLADPRNLEKFLKMKLIGGVKITEIFLRIPNLMLTSHESVQRTMDELKSFGIGEESIASCCRILTMDSKIVRSRLSAMKSRKELEAICFHPRFLNLILRKFVVESRLDYLNELEKKCFSMSVLCAAQKRFVSSSVRETDRNVSRDCVLFLAKCFNLEKEEVRKEISRHPYWLYIPFSDMKNTIDMLVSEGFQLEDIAANIYIVLYSGDLIINRIKKLSETKEIEGHRWMDLSKALQLKLVLYHIEAEFNFRGEGVWLDHQSNLTD